MNRPGNGLRRSIAEPRMGPPAKIVQTATELIFLYQQGNIFRVIPTDGRPHDRFQLRRRRPHVRVALPLNRPHPQHHAQGRSSPPGDGHVRIDPATRLTLASREPRQL